MSFLDQCIAFTGAVWDRYVRHPWIEALFAGELSEERFEYWQAQNRLTWANG
jgi:thiaminase